MPINNTVNISGGGFATASTGTELTNSLSNTATSIPANANRKGLTIFNTLSTTIYIDVSNTVSATNFWFRLAPDAFYEMPEPIYTGQLFFVIASGTGSVEIREFV